VRPDVERALCSLAQDLGVSHPQSLAEVPVTEEAITASMVSDVTH
jgi:hypothetical protein